MLQMELDVVGLVAEPARDFDRKTLTWQWIKHHGVAARRGAHGFGAHARHAGICNM